MLVDTEDLIDSHQVAAILGLTSHRSVSTYRHRYDDFPEPVLERSGTRCTLWRRQDIKAFKKQIARGQR